MIASRITSSRAFTLVEMMVIAPIVILMIGGFVALLINLTGEALSSRGADTMSYDVQNTLDQIEFDVQRSTGFLAVNDIAASTTGQGYGDTATLNSSIDFTNVAVSGGSGASLIIKTYAINGNRNNPATSLVYLANAPNACTDPVVYAENTPMSINIVYFIDTNGVLWRRTIMPLNYTSASVICGTAPWQQATCMVDYVAVSRPNCKAQDVRLLDGVSAATFQFGYYADGAATTPNATASDAGASNAARDAALLTTNTVQVDITSSKTIAGRDVSRSGSLRATRLQ